MEIKTIKLTTLEDFENLKTNDYVVIKWHKQMRNLSNEKVRNPMITRIKIIKKIQHEIILDEPKNVYFNYNMHLFPKVQGYSNCLEVHKVILLDN